MKTCLCVTEQECIDFISFLDNLIGLPIGNTLTTLTPKLINGFYPIIIKEIEEIEDDIDLWSLLTQAQKDILIDFDISHIDTSE